MSHQEGMSQEVPQRAEAMSVEVQRVPEVSAQEIPFANFPQELQFPLEAPQDIQFHVEEEEEIPMCEEFVDMPDEEYMEKFGPKLPDPVPAYPFPVRESPAKTTPLEEEMKNQRRATRIFLRSAHQGPGNHGTHKQQWLAAKKLQKQNWVYWAKEFKHAHIASYKRCNKALQVANQELDQIQCVQGQPFVHDQEMNILIKLTKVRMDYFWKFANLVSLEAEFFEGYEAIKKDVEAMKTEADKYHEGDPGIIAMYERVYRNLPKWAANAFPDSWFEIPQIFSYMI